jgi:phospholipid transport system substrate-binding protein
LKNPEIRRIRGLGAALLSALMLFAAPVSAQQNAPEAAVEALHATLLKGMKQAEKLGLEGRFRLFEPAIASNFNLQLMTAIACGPHWRKAADAQRTRLVGAFRRFSVGTYAARFTGWSGQSFRTVGTRPGPASTTLVDTRIERPGDSDPVRLSYVVRKFPAGWQIVDVLQDGGISELAVKRSEFRNILASGGVDALVKSLTERVDTLLDKGS